MSYMMPTTGSGTNPARRTELVFMCLVTTIAATRDETQDFIDHVRRIPNPNKVLNSVLGRLERNREGLLSRTLTRMADEDCEEPSEALSEYTETLQTSRERELRQLGIQNPYKTLWKLGEAREDNISKKHYPICHLERKIRRLNTNEYEYRPAYYEEVSCTMASADDVGVTNEVCSSLGFSCVQWNKTIHLTRRRYSSDCWETKSMVIPAGCECMWPVHRLGDMTLRV